MEQRFGEFEYTNLATGVHISYDICEKGGINIVDSFLVFDDTEKADFIERVQETGVCFGKRTTESLVREWKAHNILFRKGIFTKRTQDTGLDPNESWIRRAFYYIVCLIFREK